MFEDPVIIKSPKNQFIGEGYIASPNYPNPIIETPFQVPNLNSISMNRKNNGYYKKKNGKNQQTSESINSENINSDYSESLDRDQKNNNSNCNSEINLNLERFKKVQRKNSRLKEEDNDEKNLNEMYDAYIKSQYNGDDVDLEDELVS